ncbi:hypothetical protein L6164_028910 [Bauhinia variegata]|uniref:Uncharacterized protein n=1 Tax=Bauhinia variegata TaxID=167791 RepID=A0ACB9L7L9_BAUVA|nr:hypothetical protein L6164_028910 [Bauhinia variegata]
MDSTRVRISILSIFLAAALISLPPCDARRITHVRALNKIHRASGAGVGVGAGVRIGKKLKSMNHLGYYSPPESSNSGSYGIGSPSFIPPFNSLAPQPTPSSFTPPPPPPDLYPPLTPTRPPSPPHYVPSPPNSNLGPPPYGYTSPPPKRGPSPPKSVPSPPLLYLPPVVFPPPPASAPPHKGPQYAVWCVAKPTVPDPIVQEAMDYACGSGADCKSIQPNGSCYQPDTLFAHASYAFNSYWQSTKAGGGSCDFGGTAMLVTSDPSYEACEFILA